MGLKDASNCRRLNRAVSLRQKREHLMADSHGHVQYEAPYSETSYQK